MPSETNRNYSVLKGGSGRGKVNDKGGTLTWFPGGKYMSEVVFSYLLANGQAYPGTGIFVLLMKPLKHFKNFSGIGRVKPYPIIRDCDLVIVSG